MASRTEPSSMLDVSIGVHQQGEYMDGNRTRKRVLKVMEYPALKL